VPFLRKHVVCRFEGNRYAQFVHICGEIHVVCLLFEIQRCFMPQSRKQYCVSFFTEGYAYHIIYLFFESNGFFPMITSRFMGIDCMPLYRKYGVRSPSHLHMSAFPSDGTLCTAGALGLLPQYSYCIPLLKKNRIFHVKYQA